MKTAYENAGNEALLAQREQARNELNSFELRWRGPMEINQKVVQRRTNAVG